MKSFNYCFVGIVLAAILATALGCGSGPPDTRSAAQYFKDEQAQTNTPYGNIITDTVQEKDGKIEYKTEDGKKWRVGHSKRADGTYQYPTPEEVK